MSGEAHDIWWPHARHVVKAWQYYYVIGPNGKLGEDVGWDVVPRLSVFSRGLIRRSNQRVSVVEGLGRYDDKSRDDIDIRNGTVDLWSHSYIEPCDFH